MTESESAIPAESARQPARLVLPGFLYLPILLAGSLPFLPYLPRVPSRAARAALILAAVAPWPIVALLPYNWLLITLFLGTWNVLTGTAILSAFAPGSGDAVNNPVHRRLRLTMALTLAGLPAAVFLTGMEQWLSDWLWSSFYPVNASLDSISLDLAAVWVDFGLLFFFSALYATKTGAAWTPASLLRLILLVACAHVFVNQLYLALVAIPLWQLEPLAVFPAWVDRVRQILFFVLWFVSIPPLIHVCHRLWSAGKNFARAYALGLLSVGLAMISLATLTGLPIHYALLMGQRCEKSGVPEAAVPWYSKALSWSRSDNLKSYLQFRVALLYRKSGNLEEAKQAFIRVLIKYYHDSRLLLEAHEFRDKLEQNRDTTLKRVVIPGMEARTEYKNAYCVPNSLGLVLNYWGDRAGAKRIGAEITQLDKGSLITDEVFFAESRGFRSLVLPLLTLDDIFRLVDRGIPVLAFIPGHVLAVFGYDRVLQTVVTYDVSTYDIWDDERWTEFSRDWSRGYNTLGIVVPESKLAVVKEVLGQDIEKKNEAYLQFLLAETSGDDPEQMALHLRRAAGHGIFFADWQYQFITNRVRPDAVDDSAVADFLLSHDVYENQILEYLRGLYQRGDYARAISFLERYRKENRLSDGMAVLLAGCQSRGGKITQAVETLLNDIDLDNQEPAALEFLLRQNYIQEDPETASRISLKLLDAENGVSGSAATLAFWTWRRNTLVDFRDIDEALAIMENYLNRWNPYDREAIRELVEAFGLKKFRADDEFNRGNWEKKIRIYRNRLALAP